MSVFDIEKAFQKSLAQISNLPDIAWPNVKFTPTLNTSFIKPVLMPAQAAPGTLSGTYKRSGIYQIDIYVSTNKGIKTLYTIADNILDYYKDHKILTESNTKIGIIATDITKAEVIDSFYVSFLEIQYICYN